MKTRFFILTWICCILFNSVLFAIVSTARFTSIVEHLIVRDRLGSIIGDVCTIGLFSVPFSAPGLLLLVLATHFSDYFPGARQRFWFVVLFCWLGTILSYSLLFIILGTGIFQELLYYIPVSLVAVLAALLVTRHLFYKAFAPDYKNQLA